MALVQMLLESLLPSILKEMESLLGMEPDSRSEWVVGLMNEICSLFEKFIPAWLRPSEEELKVLIEDALAKLISKGPSD